VISPDPGQGPGARVSLFDSIVRSGHVRESAGIRAVFLTRIARTCAALAFLVGLAVLLGWAFDVRALKGVLPGLATMKANTALCFLLLGAAFWLLGNEAGEARRRLPGHSLAAIGAGIGFLTILEYLFSWHLGIDQALFSDPGSPDSVAPPGRMAPTTAASFLMLGTGLFLLDRPKYRGSMVGLVSGVALISGIALAGYLFNVSALYTLPGYGSVALHTAATFAILSGGILCARPERGFMRIVISDSSAGVMVRKLLPAAVLVPLALGWLRLWGQRKGFYGTEIGLSAYALSNIIIFILLIVACARALFKVEAERERALEAVRGNEERLRLMVTNSPAAIAMFDRHMRYLMVSPRWISDYSLGGRDIIGVSHYDVFPGLPERWKEIHRRCLEGAVEKSEDDSFTRPDGSVEWVRWEIHPWRDNRERIGGIVIFSEVITPRKRAEEALRKSENQLRQAQKMEAIGQLAGGVAHDFNNLLTAILGFSEMGLAGLPEGDPLAGDLKEVVKAGQRAAALTRQLLAFGRRQVLQPRMLDINDSVADIAKMLKRLIGEDIDLVTRLDPQIGRVHADPGQIEQVVMNLAVNARDAMPEGGELIIETADTELDETYLKGHPWATPGPFVMLAVTDTGTGISEEVKAHLFEPFFTTKDVGKGTGLGLATIYGIVKQSGGQISVYSERGKGTSFKIYLPRVEGQVQPKVAPPAPRTMRGSETILLVEDDESVRALAGSVLRKNGYALIVANNGVEGLEAADRHSGAIDLAITDVIMPNLRGQDFARLLSERRPNTKVLFMSGYTDASIHHRELAPDIPFLQKPFTGERLLLKVREVLESEARPARPT